MFDNPLKKSSRILAQEALNLSFLESKKIGFVYNADTALRRWRATLARIANGANETVNVVFHGDSITEGGYTTMNADDFQTKGYVGRIRTALQTKYGDVGMGFVSVTYPFGKTQWKFNGATWNGSAIGFGVLGACMTTTTAGDYADFAFNGTGVSIFFGGNTTSGKVLVSVDGGTETEFDTVDTGVNGKKEYKVTGLTSGAHTVRVKKTADARPIYLLGGAETKGTKGICVNNCSRWGMRTANAISQSSIELSITKWQPKLTIIALLANDAGQNETPENYKANILKLANEALKTGDVLLLSTGVSQSTTEASQHTKLNNALREIALQNPNIAYLDLFNRWGGDGAYVKNTLGFLQDNVHPNGGGHIDIASAVYDVIHGSSMNSII